ncbi:MAG: hypothetical protein ACTICQ_15165 [Glutamicibacter arilaitensis]|uniref:hypothetical protein n=1 Tax=Glutamicibacter arilaitensis TaxID=256701 RepID=UPI003FB654D0
MTAPKSYITEDLVEQVAIVSYEQTRIQNGELPMPSWAGAGAFNRYQHKVDIDEALKLIVPVMIEQGWKAPEPRDEIQGGTQCLTSPR